MKLGSNTKTLVLAIIINIVAFAVVPGLLSWLIELLISLDGDLVKLGMALGLIVALLTYGAMIANAIIWPTKLFTYDVVQLAQTRRAHTLWIIALSLLSSWVGLYVFGSLF